MRRLLLALGLAAAGAAQLRPGNYVVVDEDGRLWEVTPAGSVASLLRLPRIGVWSAAFDPAGRLLVGGTGILWRLDRTLRPSTLFDGLHIYPIGDLAPTSRGTILLGAMGNRYLYEVDDRGRLVSVVVLPPVSGTWGLGLLGSTLFVAAHDAQRAYVHRVDLTTGRVATLLRGPALAFYQAGAVTPAGRFVFGDETGPSLLALDAQGRLTTLWRGPPLVDPAEGLAVDPAGDLLFTDDGALNGRPTNRIFRLRGGALTTLVRGGPFFDLNGLAVIPGLFLTSLTSQVRPGGTARLRVTSVGAAGEPYVFATALSARAGFPLPGGRRFPLDPDPLFLLSALNVLPGVFRNFQGRLDPAGGALLSVAVPLDRNLVGLTLYTAGLTLHPAAPGGVHLVSSAVTTRIVP